MRLVALITLFIAGCANDPIATERTDNPSVSVDTLFQKDGCTVYRFHDVGKHHYFAKCEGASVTTMNMQSCGKNCTESVEIPTLTVEAGR